MYNNTICGWLSGSEAHISASAERMNQGPHPTFHDRDRFCVSQMVNCPLHRLLLRSKRCTTTIARFQRSRRNSGRIKNNNLSDIGKVEQELIGSQKGRAGREPHVRNTLRTGERVHTRGIRLAVRMVPCCETMMVGAHGVYR